MEPSYQLSNFRDKLENVLFLNQYFYKFGCTAEETNMAFFILQDELNELTTIYEQARNELEQQI